MLDNGFWQLWDAASGAWLCRVKPRTYRVSVIDFTSNSDEVVTGCTDGKVRIWRARTGELLDELAETQAGGPIVGLACSQTGDMFTTSFATSTEIDVRLSDFWLGRLHTFPHGAERVAFSHDGRYIAAACLDGARVWRERDGRQIHFFEKTPSWAKVTDVAFSADGNRLVMATSQSVSLYDLSTGQRITEFSDQEYPWRVAIHPDGGQIAVGELSGPVYVWDASGGMTAPSVRKIPLGKGIAFSPDGKYLATGTYEIITLTDVRSFEPIYQWKGHHDFVGRNRWSTPLGGGVGW